MTPLLVAERTVIPDELPGDDGPYARRRRLVMDVQEAARLAALVPGQRGVILFAIARGDDLHDVATMLKVSPAEVEAILAGDDGMHLIRSDR